MLLPPSPLIPPYGSPIYYQGVDLQKGTRPAVIFFALSAQMSLFEDPFNPSILRLSEQGIRVFSWDLPFHGPGQNPQDAMYHWAQSYVENPSFIFDFIDLCQINIDYLIAQKLVDPQYLAVAGLSRGAFIATHLAARDPRIKIVLGFAPLTYPQTLEEIPEMSAQSLEKIALISVVEHLIHVRLRFYIGNRDTRVGTDACYTFIQALTEIDFTKGIRSPPVELMIYPSIGHKGHGTPSSIFYEGADWLKQQLIL